MATAQNTALSDRLPSLFFAAKDCTFRTVIGGPKAADYEAELSQSGAKAATVSAQKFVERAPTVSDIIGEQFVVPLRFEG